MYGSVKVNVLAPVDAVAISASAGTAGTFPDTFLVGFALGTVVFLDIGVFFRLLFGLTGLAQPSYGTKSISGGLVLFIAGYYATSLSPLASDNDTVQSGIE